MISGSCSSLTRRRMSIITCFRRSCVARPDHQARPWSTSSNHTSPPPTPPDTAPSQTSIAHCVGVSPPSTTRHQQRIQISPVQVGFFFTPLDQPAQAMKSELKVFASPGGSVIPGTQWVASCASTEDAARSPKIRIITISLLRGLSEIKLKRTDTTLDLSQKAK